MLLFGGIETTEGMIAGALLHLLERPDQLELTRERPELLDGAIEESLRLEPAAAVIDRYATRDARLGGAQIAAGDLVRLSHRRREPGSGRVRSTRTVSISGGPTPAGIWPSPTDRTSAWVFISPGWRPEPAWPCYSARCQDCVWTRRSRPSSAGWCSASHPRCTCAGTQRVLVPISPPVPVNPAASRR